MKELSDITEKMDDNNYADELERALARADSGDMRRVVRSYAQYFAEGAEDWPDDKADDFGDVVTCHHDDPDKALAYIVIAAADTDDPEFLGYMGCGPLEDVLRDPSPELLARIVAEAQKSPRFRWLLSNPFRVAIAPTAWKAIEKFRITGPHEEPADDTLPPR